MRSEESPVPKEGGVIKDLYSHYIRVDFHEIGWMTRYGSNPGPEVSHPEKHGSNPEKKHDHQTIYQVT